MQAKELWRLKKRRIGAEKAALLAFDEHPVGFNVPISS